VTCPDQIARLRDLNGDDEIDLIENFKQRPSGHRTFPRVAMGLQTDAEGNFFYAKSARHALPRWCLIMALCSGQPRWIEHGDRRRGFRAANGVCLNPDGSFFVTDQEGHWTPKNDYGFCRAVSTATFRLSR